MAHILEVMTSVCSQLNYLAKEYFGDGKARTMPKIMDSIYNSVDIASKSVPSIDKREELTIDKGIFANNGDKSNPVYVISVKNLKEAYVDKFVSINKSGDNELVNAMLIAVPYYVFENEADFSTVCDIIMKMYCKILDTDLNMEFDANSGILRFCQSNVVTVHSYDIEMMLSAVLCTWTNIKSWFKNYDRDDNQVPPEDMLEIFSATEMPDNIRTGCIDVINRHGNGGTNDIRDGIVSGSILKDFIDGVNRKA